MDDLFLEILILKVFSDGLIQNICLPPWALFQTVYSLL